MTSPATGPAVAVIVMGVTGCGKTTVGTLLGQRLGVPYLEADDFHSAASVAKMKAGIPLGDEDRRPWLAAIGQRLAAEGDRRPVVSCSALKRQYRDLLRSAEPRIWFLHLAIDEATTARRVAARPDHFMPASLVASQFADLEPLDGEPGYTVDATAPPPDITAAAMRRLTQEGLVGSK
ncbi:MAG TPA: gluconokinase [Streptosporangiaceae bacterium]|nr:gluconokinase [Streptosporangiaceae bacterium]